MERREIVARTSEGLDKRYERLGIQIDERVGIFFVGEVVGESDRVQKRLRVDTKLSRDSLILSIFLARIF